MISRFSLYARASAEAERGAAGEIVLSPLQLLQEVAQSEGRTGQRLQRFGPVSLLSVYLFKSHSTPATVAITKRKTPFGPSLHPTLKAGLSTSGGANIPLYFCAARDKFKLTSQTNTTGDCVFSVMQSPFSGSLRGLWKFWKHQQ